MRPNILCCFILLISILAFACRQPENNVAAKALPRLISVLPLGDIDSAIAMQTFDSIKKALPEARLLPPKEMPAQAWYAARSRYRADTLIRWLRMRVLPNETIIAITAADISTTKGKMEDYGVMGLGYKPGPACIASSFRLKNQMALYKIALHELGHTAGLPHCPNETCFMRDAEGKDHTREEKAFCANCRQYLLQKGWQL